MLAVNTLAPYLVTGLIEPPARLIYLTSDLHLGGDVRLHDLDRTARRRNGTQAYCDSKLFVTALAFAIARRGRTPFPRLRAVDVEPAAIHLSRTGLPGARDPHSPSSPIHAVLRSLRSGSSSRDGPYHCAKSQDEGGSAPS